MPTVQLTITELPGYEGHTAPAVAPSFFGLKINQDTLDTKQVTIEDVIDLMGLTELKYVVGFDTKLSESAKPHYHIHWLDTRTLEALRKHKGRNLKAYGKDCKLYPAKNIEGTKHRCDEYVWFGYACKESKILTSVGIDHERLTIEAAIQNKVKCDKLKYEDIKAFKKAQQQSFEEELFDILTDKYPAIQYDHVHGFKWWAQTVYSHSMFDKDRHLTKTPLEILVWKFLLKTKRADPNEYIHYLFPHSS